MSVWDYLNGDTENVPPRFCGVCPAVVTNIKDPDNLCRVRVKLLNLDLPDYETDFIRVMTPMTGDGWGALFFPNVGDEVLVAFCGGDISRGYVLGSLRNKNFKPPAQIKEDNPIRMIQTKAGHKLIFDDTDGKESVEIQTKGDLDIVLDDEKKRIIVRDKGKKNSVAIDSENGAITITAEKKVNISAGSTKIILESSGSLSMTSDSKASVRSSKVNINGDSAEIKASSTMTVSSGGQTAVKGSIVKIN